MVVCQIWFRRVFVEDVMDHWGGKTGSEPALATVASGDEPSSTPPIIAEVVIRSSSEDEVLEEKDEGGEREEIEG